MGKLTGSSGVAVASTGISGVPAAVVSVVVAAGELRNPSGERPGKGGRPLMRMPGVGARLECFTRFSTKPAGAEACLTSASHAHNDKHILVFTADGDGNCASRCCARACLVGDSAYERSAPLCGAVDCIRG